MGNLSTIASIAEPRIEHAAPSPRPSRYSSSRTSSSLAGPAPAPASEPPPPMRAASALASARPMRFSCTRKRLHAPTAAATTPARLDPTPPALLAARGSSVGKTASSSSSAIASCASERSEASSACTTKLAVPCATSPERRPRKRWRKMRPCSASSAQRSAASARWDPERSWQSSTKPSGSTASTLVLPSLAHRMMEVICASCEASPREHSSIACSTGPAAVCTCISHKCGRAASLSSRTRAPHISGKPACALLPDRCACVRATP
mmetsp:Transcript_11959/g.50317  ORF Transcript_11959/g.50317 Transcript_11959/m.50317 type:complete len:265 (-) Transcript_11959:196-990(-)